MTKNVLLPFRIGIDVCATNAYLSRAMDVYQIMKCTGYKTESSFLSYLKVDGKDFAIQAADSEFFKDDYYSAMKIAS